MEIVKTRRLILDNEGKHLATDILAKPRSSEKSLSDSGDNEASVMVFLVERTCLESHSANRNLE